MQRSQEVERASTKLSRNASAGRGRNGLLLAQQAGEEVDASMPTHVLNALALCPMCADKAADCTMMAQLKTQGVAAVFPAQASTAESQDNPRLLVGTAELPEGSGGSLLRPGAKQHSDLPAKSARFSSSGTNSSSSSSSSSASKRKAAAKRRPPPGPRQGARQASASARNLGSQAGRQTEGTQKPAANSEGKRAASKMP